MVRMHKRILRVATALMLAVVVAGCGGSGSSASQESAVATDDAGYSSYDEEYAVDERDGGETNGATAKLDEPEKMVYTADVSLSSREYDHASEELDARISAAGAIVFGDNMWQSEWSDRVSRTRELTVRVAAEGLKDFVRSLGQIDSVKVTSSNLHASDKTKQYNDSESRIQLLQQEYDFYEQTVTQTTDPETRLVYTERMFELLDQIKQLENTKAEIDQDVAYSVVNITLVEDNALANHDGSVGLWQQIQDAFLLIPQNVAAAFGYVLLFLIEALPLLLILGAIAFVVVLVVRRIRAKRPRRKDTPPRVDDNE